MKSNRISKFGKFVVVIMSLVMTLGMLPNAALAETETSLGQVHVIVENTTFLEATEASRNEAPAWTGKLVDTYVDLKDDSTMMSLIVEALSDYEVVGAETGYISSINGLGEFDGGGESGWMGTINDWFTSEGFQNFTVEEDEIVDGDEIRIMYTTNGKGEDLGGTWGNSDKTVSNVSFSAGTLNPTFDKDTHTYTLTLSSTTTAVKVTPTASNKNFQIKTYLGTQADGTEYRRSADVPVTDGCVITVVCGDPSWPSMNDSTDAAQTYTFNVKIEQTPVTAWDGTTMTEPKKDTAGVYQIGTGEELAWFVNEYGVNGTAIIGVLTNDIDLNNKAWISTITSKSNSLKLDGQNHKITGLNATYGLIPKISTNSVLKNLTVYGKVSCNENNVGGIVGYTANDVTLENCVNYATVSGKDNVGGVAGYMTLSTGTTCIVKNCANYGTVTGTGEKVGGVIGYLYFNGSNFTFINCYNTTKISGTNNVGGVIGYAEKKGMSFTNCYNTGAISGTDAVGGLFGYARGSNQKNPLKVSNSYSSGSVSGTGSNVYPIVGKSYSNGDLVVLSTDTYYISGSKTDQRGGTPVTEKELKSAIGLDSKHFKSVCGDYPALVSQSDVTSHTKDTGIITKPTCTEGGYTTYTCPTCSITYKADFVEALDHDYCTHDIFSTCDDCQVEGENLIRKCRRDGCTATKSDPLTTYTITLPTETAGYTVASTSGYTTTVVKGEDYSFKVTIDNEYKKGTDFAVKVNDVAISEAGGVYTITNVTENKTITVIGVVPKTNADKGFTVTAPAGSTITAGRLHTYYKYDFVEPIEIGTTADGKVYAIFPVPSGSESFFRVQNPNGVTYWDFNSLSVGGSVEVTDEMLYIGSSEFTPDTVYSKFEKSIYDKADIYLNINAKNYLTLSSTGSNNTYELNVFRNWMALGNSTANTSVALPDVHYTVISPDGGESDVVTVTPDSKNSCVATVKANKKGTAIILVTYDAMTNADGLGGKQFSAIWPENTGVFVVSVDENTDTVTTNMKLNETLNAEYSKTDLDAEHDILFYVGDSGAEYSFKPEAGCTVTVARSTVGTSMTFNGFTDSNIVTVDDGTVTVKGLSTGTHIIKVTKGDAVTYQVVRARKVSYTLTGSDGKTIDKDNPAEAGEKVTVQFSGLISPIEKLAGVYNCNFGFYYKGQDDTTIRIPGGYYGVYTFNSSASLQNFEVTIPENWNSLSYTLSDGAIRIGGFGSFAGDHRSVRYVVGRPVNNTASEIDGILSSLPDIVIPTVSYNVKDFESAVDALPTNIALSDKANVEAVRAKYKALTSDEKALVDADKLAKLEAAEAKIASFEKAKAVDDAVNALPAKDKLTLSDESKVTAAREMYKALANDEKALVKADSLTKLTSLEQRIADLKAAKAVDDEINTLPAENKVEISDKAKVEDVKAKYNALTPEQKALVASASTEKLEKLEKVIADKEAAKAVDDKIESIDMSASDRAVKVANVKADYNALTENQKKFVTKLDILEGYEAQLADEEKAAAVDALIDEIDNDITLNSKKAVRKARKAYDDLTPAQKNLVENYAALTRAEAELSSLLIQQAEDLINALPEKDEITLNDKEAIEEARAAYDELTDDEKKEISNDTFKKLTDAEKAYEKIVPKTGDNNNVFAYSAVLMVSAVAFMGVVICRKKRSM